MADYWKSNARKFCDFCKCWIADNKPSIEFHEKGKRHKENVTKRLSEMSKKSAKEFKAQLKVEDEIKKMEEAALLAYMKDVEAGADYTSIMLGGGQTKDTKTEEPEESDTTAAESPEVLETVEVQKPEVKWYEAKSDEGYTYYWNTETGESCWEPPETGFLSIKEQKKLEKESVKQKRQEEHLAKEEDQRIKEEQRAFMEREKMKKRRVKEEEKKPDKEEQNTMMFGPAPRIDPYGAWQTVEKKVEQHIDLQLPPQEHVPIKVPVVVQEEPRKRFKEKTVSDLGLGPNTDCDVTFKKRKLNIAPKKFMRQRLDEDD